MPSNGSFANDANSREVIAQRVVLGGGEDAPRRARIALDSMAPGWLAGRGREDVHLMTSELVANSVRHAGADDDHVISLDVTVVGHLMHVGVADDGPGFDPGSVPTPDPSRGHGWGLAIVEALAARWGVVARPSQVWFEFDHDLGPAQLSGESGGGAVA